MPEYQAPGVYVDEGPLSPGSIAAVPTAVTLFAGWASRGPVDRVVRVTSVGEYLRSFGPLHSRSLLGHAVGHFFANGGGDARILRIADPEGTTAACDIGPLHLEASSPGAWANALAVRVTRTPADAARFDIEVIDTAGDAAVLESYADLSLRPDDPRFAPRVLAASMQLGPATASSDAAPPEGMTALDATTVGGGAVLDPEHPALLAALAVHFAPDGLADRAGEVGLICVPGLTDAPTVALLQQAARRRLAFLVLDCAETDTAASVAGSLAGRTGPDARNAALYFPWVLARDACDGGLRAFPPSGFVAGVIARTDGRRGVWTAPAGQEATVVGADDLARPVAAADVEALTPLGVNGLRVMPRAGALVWGARTLSADPEWRYVPVRRTALFIEASLARGLQWAVFEPNDAPLWDRIRAAVGAFLEGLFRAGAFRGTQRPRRLFRPVRPEHHHPGRHRRRHRGDHRRLRAAPAGGVRRPHPAADRRPDPAAQLGGAFACPMPSIRSASIPTRPSSSG